MRVLIDADGCPVVDITVRLAQQYGVPCVILCDTAHEIARKGAETVVVSKGADSVDFAIVNRILPGDIIITQDYGLAAMCLAKGGLPVRQDGLLYTPENMDALLNSRYLAKAARRAGARMRGPSKRTVEQDEAFAQALVQLLCAK